MTATNRPRISAASLADAATRLFGTIVLDLADLTITPAVYKPATATFLTVDGEEYGVDDGTLVNLLESGVTARDVIAEHGTAGAAAAALTRRLRAEGTL